jgi:hypothetical protein
MLPLLVYFRSTGYGRSWLPYIYVHDFGYFSGGTLTFSWNLRHPTAPIPVTMLLFKSSDYSNWKSDRSRLNDWHVCAAEDCAVNWSVDLTSDPVTATFPIPDSATYTVIVEHCQEGLTSEYYIDAQFMNPDGQHLDSRHVPLLTALPILIPLFGLLVMGYSLFLRCKTRKVARTQLCLCIVIASYVVVLTLSEIGLTFRSKYDAAETPWFAVETVLEGLYDIFFLSFLMVCAGGWGVFNLEKRYILEILSVSLFIISYFVFYCAALLYETPLWFFAIVGIVQGASLVWIGLTVYRNWKTVNQKLIAHLYVIHQDNVRPDTTPPYTKWKEYGTTMFVYLSVALAFDVVNVLWLVIRQWWLGRVLKNVVHFISFGVFAVAHRDRRLEVWGKEPRGDVRREVRADDLEKWDPTFVSEGMREWRNGMRLPAAPDLIGKDGKIIGREKRPLDDGSDTGRLVPLLDAAARVI